MVGFTALVFKSPPITRSQIGDLIAKIDLWAEKLNIKEVKSPPFPLYVPGGGRWGFILISALILPIIIGGEHGAIIIMTVARIDVH